MSCRRTAPGTCRVANGWWSRLTPAGTMARVEFFVDGQRVCQRERLPFECDWDAGAGGEARVVRVLATLADGAG